MSTSATAFINWLTRAGLCSAYVYSGVDKLFDWQGGLAEQRHFGLEPAAAFLLATVILQLGGSVLVLFTSARAAATGALALAVFTLAATIVGHAFWVETGIDRFRDLNSFLEHLGLIGGFVLVALIQLRHPRENVSGAILAPPTRVRDGKPGLVNKPRDRRIK